MQKRKMHLLYLIDLLTSLMTRMRAMEDFLAGGGHLTPPPPEPPVISMVTVIPQSWERENCMRTIERFRSCGHLSFKEDQTH